MNTYFGPDFFTNNRMKLRALIDSSAPIVITANGSMQRAADEPYKFVQDSNFWYLTGLNTPDLTLVITAGETYLMAPTLSIERQTFDGAHDVSDFTNRSGIAEVVDERAGWQRLHKELNGSHTVASLGAAPSFLTRHRLHSLPYRRRLIAKLKRVQPGVDIQDIRPQLATLRAVKQPQELKALQRAIDITAETLLEVAIPAVLGGAKHEYELEAAISYGFRHRGADGHAFEPIVGAGAHSTTLHHVDNAGRVAMGDMIVLDVGASVEHYAADITRTVCQRPMSARQQVVFNAVAAVQDFALSQLKPGILLQEYERRVEMYMGEQLVALGLITDASHENIRRYFPHASSHFLGLDTHDVGDYRLPLAENMVVTCEPGIYITEENIGIRIEDDVLITKAGNEVLSSACPRRLESVQ